MTETDQLQYVQLMHLLAPALAPDALVTPASAALPAAATTTHYARDGTTISALSRTDCAGLLRGPDGRIDGGHIVHVARDPDGAPASRSTIAMDGQGRAATLRTEIAHRFRGGILKIVEADLGGLQWTAAATVHAGQVVLVTRDAASGAVRMEGRLRFDAERLQGARFALRAWPGDGLVHNYVDVDYRQTQMCGHHAVGGQLYLTFSDAAGMALSRSVLALTPHGTVRRIETTAYVPATGAIRTLVVADLDKLRHAPAGHILDGTVTLTVSAPDGALRSTTEAAFAAGVPVHTLTQAYRRGKPTVRLETDYAGARFDNDLHVVDSTVVTRMSDAAGRLLVVASAAYDGHGRLVRRRRECWHRNTGQRFLVQVSDHAATRFDPRGRAVGGTIVTTTMREGGPPSVSRRTVAPPVGVALPRAAAFAEAPPAPSAAAHYSREQDAGDAGAIRTERILRPDGTLLRLTQTRFDGALAVAATISDFATDGRALVSSSEFDLSGLAVAGDGSVSGKAVVRRKFQGVTPCAVTEVQFVARPGVRCS